MPGPDLRKQIGEQIFQLLKPLGFKRKGYEYARELSEVTHYINLQSSSSSTATRRVLTLNVGVLSKTVTPTEGGFVPTPGLWACKWRKRLGYLGPEQTDKWWTVESQSDADRVFAEMKDLLERYALRMLARISTQEELDTVLRTKKLPATDG